MPRIIALTLILSASTLFAAPPAQRSVSPVLGPKLFRDGDVIEITDFTATSPRLEQGDTVTVKGRVRLDSCQQAHLGYYLTQTEGDGLEETDSHQTTTVEHGQQKFKLTLTIKHEGAMHLSLYDLKTHRPFGGVYFGTEQQMKEIEDWDLGYYLQAAPQEESQ